MIEDIVKLLLWVAGFMLIFGDFICCTYVWTVSFNGLETH